MTAEDDLERRRWFAVALPAADAVSAEHGHPLGPEVLATSLAAALRDLHDRPVDECPFSADTAELRRVVDERLADGVVSPALDGPYVGREPQALAGIFDALITDLGPTADPAIIHGGLAPDRIWLDPTGHVSFQRWNHAGVGDRHLDLAAVAVMLTTLHGPALVGPFVEAYGFDRVDLRRLDAHQILAHLLA